MAEHFILCTYILFGFTWILFISSQKQSKHKYRELLDDLDEKSELSELSTSISISTPISQPQSTTNVPKGQVIPTVSSNSSTQTNQPNTNILQKTCTLLLTQGSWKHFKMITNPKTSPEYNPTSIVFQHDVNFTKMKNLYKSNETYDFTYSGDFENPNCKIHNYKTSEIKQCFNEYHEILMFGDSRTRVLFRVLRGRYDGLDLVTDYRDHREIDDPPFTFYWSVNFKITLHILFGTHVKNDQKIDELSKSKLSGKSNGKRLVIIGEQLQWPQVDFLHGFNSKGEPTRNCTQQGARSNIDPYLDHAKTLIQQLDQFNDTEFLFMSAESRYDIQRMSESCHINWNTVDWDSLSKYYTDSIRNLLAHYKPKNGMLMETNRITMEKELDGGKSRQHLMTDGVHKMSFDVARNPNFVPKKIPSSLAIDSDVVFNYFCNKKFNFEGTCCNN